MGDQLIVRGARENNLRDVNVELPRDKLIVFTGISGSGKSSLAFDTIYAEGQRRYVESLSAYARQFLGQMDKPVVMSTGMATMEEVRAALNVLLEVGAKKEKITILHCNTEYPTPIEDVNLKTMLTIRDELDVAVGYSDHTLGIEIPVAAVAMGATVIEKHFTLDRTLPGPDHAASLEPRELKTMVVAIRNIEKAIGDGVKKPSSSEIKNIYIARKSIVAKKISKRENGFQKII